MNINIYLKLLTASNLEVSFLFVLLSFTHFIAFICRNFFLKILIATLEKKEFEQKRQIKRNTFFSVNDKRHLNVEIELNCPTQTIHFP